MKKFISYFFQSIFILGIYACQSEVEYPPEPNISFLDFTSFDGDSAHFTFSFTDGDGDLGLSETDTSGDFRFNVFFTYSELSNNEWTVFDLGEGTNYRIPQLHAGPDEKALSGETTITLNPYYNPGLIFPALSDTFKWSVYITDRNLNKSNTIESGIVIKPN